MRHALFVAAALLAACAPEVGDDPIETDTATTETDTQPDPDAIWEPCGGLCACVGDALLQCPAPPPSEGCESTPAGLFLGLWLQECGTVEDLWGL